MNKKRYYFIILFTISILFLIYVPIMQHFEKLAKGYLLYTYHVIIIYFFYVVFGAFMGIEKFIENYKLKGKWYLDYDKLFILGIPALIFASGIFGFKSIFWIKLVTTKGFNQFTGMFLGYILITSLYKKRDNN